MKYEILSSLRTPSTIEAVSILEKHVQAALKSGGQLVGGVSVIYGALSQNSEACYEAFQAVLTPAD